MLRKGFGSPGINRRGCSGSAWHGSRILEAFLQVPPRDAFEPSVFAASSLVTALTKAFSMARLWGSACLLESDRT